MKLGARDEQPLHQIILGAHLLPAGPRLRHGANTKHLVYVTHSNKSALCNGQQRDGVLVGNSPPDLVQHAVGVAGEASIAADEHNVGQQLSVQLDGARSQRVRDGLADAALLEADIRRPKEQLGRAKALIVEGEQLVLGHRRG